MPTRRKLCSKGGCYLPAETGSHRCKFHPFRERADHHPFRHLYGTNRWRKASASFLAANPLCRHCLEQGVTTPATVTDHIEPHGGDEAAFWDVSNWQGLCASHHSVKTAREVNARQ